MLEGERVQQREQAVAKTYRVELVRHLFSGTCRRVDAGERGPLFIERDPDVRDVRHWLVIKEVVGPCGAVMAGQRNVNVMPHIRVRTVTGGPCRWLRADVDIRERPEGRRNSRLR
jgi:predicted thioredoxin/glutaredoxin